MIPSFFKNLFVWSPAPSSSFDHAAAQFSAGYLYGITSLDKRDYILGCFQPNDKLTENLNYMNIALKDEDFSKAS